MLHRLRKWWLFQRVKWQLARLPPEPRRIIIKLGLKRGARNITA